MWSIRQDYLRARKRRLIKTIICTTCAGVALAITNIDMMYLIIGTLLLGLIVWYISSSAVDDCQQIYMPGETQCRKR